MVSRNFLYFALGAMAIVGVALGFQSYREQQRTIGHQIDVGISVPSK